MAAEDHLQSRQMGMVSEAVRRDAAKQHGVDPGASNAPQVTAGLVSHDLAEPPFS